MISKKRKISIVKKKKKKISIKTSNQSSISQSKISSSFGQSIESKKNNPNNDLINNKYEINDINVEKIEDMRDHEMELTDKPLKSMFLFKNMKEMPINCSEKDSITYKIGSLQKIII